VILLLFKQPGSNIIETVDRVNALLPALRKAIPAAINLNVMMDRTPVIRSSLREVEQTLCISILLVILVVFLFLRNARAALIPSVAVPVSLIGTCAIMYLCGFSLDALSLMALTVAAGFVVDDAIVVVENSARHLEEGATPYQAALRGAQEVCFTVISMSVSLIAVFVPILFMGGIIGRIFREFAITLSAAVLVSLVVSLTLTPMMCARYLRVQNDDETSNVIFRWSKWLFDRMQYYYGRTLSVALAHSRLMLLLLLATFGLNVFLYIQVPKGFFPQQDMGRIMGNIQADQGISFQLMKKHLDNFMAIVKADPAVRNVVGFTGGIGQRNGGNLFITLKPWKERNMTSDEVVARLRGKTSSVAGAKLFLQSAQDVRMGGRQSNAQYQYTLQSAELSVLREWAPKLFEEFKKLPQLADVSTDQQDSGSQIYITYDRDTMSRFGITPVMADAALSNAFSQRQISTIYNPLNQYNVVLAATEDYLQDQDGLNSVYVKAKDGSMVALSSFSSIGSAATPLAVNHQGQFASGTLSFNLAAGFSLGQAKEAIDAVFRRLAVPDSLQGGFQGTAKVFQDSLASQPLLILAALLTIYIVLGMLYESTIHPITILSTLPSAGVGAILALMLCGIDFTIIALIGVLLLIGIVKKNAILMIDFAVDAERREGLSPRDAIYRACMLRFRPIMMTTMAALFGALPLALGFGEGAEIRQPLGVSIVGGLIVSQILTLYTTPVVYLALDTLRLKWIKGNNRLHHERVMGV
jgi:multidrug efflux pump